MLKIWSKIWNRHFNKRSKNEWSNRVGFPLSAYNKVVNTLEDNKISYTDKYNNKSSDYKRKNNYNKLLDLGKRKYSLNYRIEKIMEKMSTLGEKDIDNILDYIESYEW